MDASELLRRYAAGERDFSGACMYNTDMRGAVMYNTDIQGTKISKARLRMVNQKR